MSGLKRLGAAAAVVGLAAIGTAAMPHKADAWVRFGFIAPPVVVAPPVYAPPPVYVAPPAAYYPPPVYYAPRPHVWIPPHWNGPYWVPGHWR